MFYNRDKVGSGVRHFPFATISYRQERGLALAIVRGPWMGLAGYARGKIALAAARGQLAKDMVLVPGTGRVRSHRHK